MALRKTSILRGRAVRGFSLIEIIIVMALFISVAGLGLFVSMDAYRGFMFRNERDVVVSILNKARSQGLNNMCFGSPCVGGKAHGVHFQSTGYVVFQGYTYASRDSAVDEFVPFGDAASSVAPLTDVVFSPLAATTTPVTLTVTGQNGQTSVVTVKGEGQISWTK